MIASLTVLRLRNSNKINNFKTRQQYFSYWLTRPIQEKIFKNLQERDNNYRNIVLSCFPAALVKVLLVVNAKIYFKLLAYYTK